MLSLRLLAVGCCALQVVNAVPRLSRESRHEVDIAKRSASSFLATEVPIALADMLCNIGSSGSCAAGADSGIVIASPSKTNPDCKNHFVRNPCYTTLTDSRLLHLDSRFGVDLQMYRRHLCQLLLILAAD